MGITLIAHIAGGSLALASGAVALVTRKGGRIHRLAGNIYLGAMGLMAVMGALVAAAAGVQVSVLAAVLTLYLVATGWIAGRRADGSLGRLDPLLLVGGLAVAVYGAYLGLRALDGHGDVLDDGFVVPPTIYFLFAGAAGLGVATDAWAIVRGELNRRARILRHVWRMCFALYIAASSLFQGQQDVFPEAVQGTFVLDAPPMIVLALMITWLLIVAFTRRFAPVRVPAER